jgi:hypothetical protein
MEDHQRATGGVRDRVVTDPMKRRVPTRCFSCDTADSVRLERTIKGQAVLLMWCCRRCNAQWPVMSDTSAESMERRQGPRERRAKTRNDRRL